MTVFIESITHLLDYRMALWFSVLLNVNLALLKKHLAENQAAGSSVLNVEVGGIRVGD